MEFRAQLLINHVNLKFKQDFILIKQTLIKQTLLNLQYNQYIV